MSNENSSIHIVPADRTQLNGLLLISKTTFVETFADSNDAADMNRYLEENMTLQRLEKEMQTTGSAFYFALAGDEIAGYLKVNTGAAQSEMKDDPHTMEIERIYLLQKFQGKKIGLLLMQYAINLARASQKNKIWLGVWEHNHKAIQFYEKNGFSVFGKHAFMLGTDLQTDILMERAL